jgi:DNA-binding HxlR family transcriptional regulator
MPTKIVNSSTIPPLVSPLLRTVELLGDGWTFFILRESFFGTRRFDGFQRALGIPRARLAERLSKLVKDNVLIKREYEDHPPRYEYLLSEAGHDIYGMTLLMKKWGDTWRQHTPRPGLQLVHRACGEPLVPDLVCRECRGPVDPGSVEIPQIDSSIHLQPNFTVRRQLLRQAFQQDSRNDSVARTLAVIGDQWAMVLVNEALMYGTNTFDGFKSRLGIARSTLSSRLKHLVAENVLIKIPYQQNPRRYTYKLTEAGRDLMGIYLLMYDWGGRWRCHINEHILTLSHKPCGAAFSAQVICRFCEMPVQSYDVERVPEA